VRAGLVRSHWLATQTLDRLHLRWLQWRHPGLRVADSASPALAAARYNLAPDARLEIGPPAATERRPGALNFVLYPGSRVVVERGTWLRTEVGPLTLVAYADARIHVGPHCLFNGCLVSAKRSVRVGAFAMLGPGTRVYDADQHDLDDAHPERFGPVEIGDHAWVSSDVTVLRGVRIGAHSVVGARSVVTANVPPHTLVLGAPAQPRGRVGDRSATR